VMCGTPTLGWTRPSTSRPDHDHRGRSAPRRSTLGSADASATCHQQRLNENLNTVVKKPDPASPHPVRRPHQRVPKHRLTSHDGVSGPHMFDFSHRSEARTGQRLFSLCRSAHPGWVAFGGDAG
jgi:hypothetical protein